MRMRRNFESLSLRLVSRCLRTATAFFTRCQRSSGIWGANPEHNVRNWHDKESLEPEHLLTLPFEDTEDLVTRNESHLGDTVRVTEGDTDLGGSETLTSELDDVVNDILGCRLQP